MKIKTVLFAIIMVVIPSIFVLGYNLKEYYPLVKGNSWKYLIIENEICNEETIKVDDKEIIGEKETIKVLSPDEKDYICLTIDSDGIKKYKEFDEEEDENIFYESPLLIFPQDIKVGESKEYLSSAVIFGINGIQKDKLNIKRWITLESIEDVEVNKEKFNNCLKFSIRELSKKSNNDYSEDECSIWMAFGIGIVKEFCISTEYSAETREKNISIYTKELISAVIDGNKIVSQDMSSR